MKSSKYTIHYLAQFILQTVLNQFPHHLSGSQQSCIFLTTEKHDATDCTADAKLFFKTPPLDP